MHKLMNLLKITQFTYAFKTNIETYNVLFRFKLRSVTFCDT